MQTVEHPIQKLIHQHIYGQIDPTMGLDIAGGVPQVRAHHGVAMMIVPRTTMFGHEVVFRFDPVALGVEQCAVHVPENGGWKKMVGTHRSTLPDA